MLGKFRALDTKIKLMKWVYGVSAPSCLVLGLWIAIAPRNFWGLLQVDYVDPLSQVLYGCVLVGIGVICLLGFRKPLQYTTVLLLMAVYKGIASIAVICHMSYLAATGADMPWAGWFIAAIWACLAAMCALVYPWGKGEEILEKMKNE